MDMSEDQTTNDMEIEEDDNAVVAGTSGSSEIMCSRCAVKISVTSQENAHEAFIIKLREIFNTIHRAGDRKSFLAP